MNEEERKREYQEFLKKVHSTDWVCGPVSRFILWHVFMCSFHSGVMDKLQEISFCK